MANEGSSAETVRDTLVARVTYVSGTHRDTLTIVGLSAIPTAKRESFLLPEPVVGLSGEPPLSKYDIRGRRLSPAGKQSLEAHHHNVSQMYIDDVRRGRCFILR